MKNWLKLKLLQLLAWLLGESLEMYVQRVREEICAAATQKAVQQVRRAKHYKRTAHYKDGTHRTVEGDCDTICKWTDAALQELHESPLVEVVEKM